MDEAGLPASAGRRPAGRLCSHDGRAARGPSFPDRGGPAGREPGGRFDFRESQTVWAERGLREVSSRSGKRPAPLEQAGVDVLFAPTVEEMYPAGFRTSVNVEGLCDRLEGRIRPGHFRGVATVVLKLLEIVAPRFAYFGRKDAQQARIIRQMAIDLALDSGNRGLPDRARAGRAGDFVAQPLSLARRAQCRDGALPRAFARAARDRSRRARHAENRHGGAAGVGRRAAGVRWIMWRSWMRIRSSRWCGSRLRCLVLLAVRFGSTRLIDNMQVEMDSRRRSDLHPVGDYGSWRPSELLDGLQHFGGVALGRRLVPDFGDAAIGPDQERGAHDAQKRFAQELLHPARAVGFDGLEFRIAQQRKSSTCTWR